MENKKGSESMNPKPNYIRVLKKLKENTEDDYAAYENCGEKEYAQNARKQCNVLAYAIKCCKRMGRLPSIGKLHEIWFKTTGYQISLTIAKGLNEIHKRLGTDG